MIPVTFYGKEKSKFLLDGVDTILYSEFFLEVLWSISKLSRVTSQRLKSMLS